MDPESGSQGLEVVYKSVISSAFTFYDALCTDAPRNSRMYCLNYRDFPWFYPVFLLLLQTLEHAFLQLCQSSDQDSIQRESTPQGGTLEKSQSFESGRDESQPILGIGPPPADKPPKCSGICFSFFFLSDNQIFSSTEGFKHTQWCQLFNHPLNYGTFYLLKGVLSEQIDLFLLHHLIKSHFITAGVAITCSNTTSVISSTCSLSTGPHPNSGLLCR